MHLNVPESRFPTVVIVGGGFAGLHTASVLEKANFRVIMIDRHNYHTFQPLLYQVATAGLEPDSVAYPLRRSLQNTRNFFFRMADVQQVIPEQKILQTNRGDLKYDYLILATGSTTNFFGNANLERFSYPMKSIPEALNLRSLILQQFEKATLLRDEQQKNALMNFVIVGAGPTGVELAGALAELKQNALPIDYPDLDVEKMNITLIEAMSKVLGVMSEKSSTNAKKYLENLGVNVMLNTAVADYDGEKLTYANGNVAYTKTVIWTAGVKGAAVKGPDTAINARNGRIKTDSYNRVEGYENIFAIGDVAEMTSEQLPKGHPMVAQVAIQQGTNLGKNLIRMQNGKELVPFVYNDKGSMATVGKNKAVVDIGKIHFSGLFAWFIWMFIHLLALVGFRNKMVTFFNWVYNYFKYDKGIRLIIRPAEEKV
jgi:NADH dehydrogenase